MLKGASGGHSEEREIPKKKGNEVRQGNGPGKEGGGEVIWKTWTKRLEREGLKQERKVGGKRSNREKGGGVVNNSQKRCRKRGLGKEKKR